MAVRLLPRTLPELYAHALVMERDATKRFEIFAHCMRETGADHLAEEFDAIGKEEREQYELLAAGTKHANLTPPSPWEYAWHYMGPAGAGSGVPFVHSQGLLGLQHDLGRGRGVEEDAAVPGNDPHARRLRADRLEIDRDRALDGAAIYGLALICVLEAVDADSHQR